MHPTESVDPVIENPRPRLSPPARGRYRNRSTTTVRARAHQSPANALVVRTVYPEIVEPTETLSARKIPIVDFLELGTRGTERLPIPIQGRITYRHRGLRVGVR